MLAFRTSIQIPQHLIYKFLSQYFVNHRIGQFNQVLLQQRNRKGNVFPALDKIPPFFQFSETDGAIIGFFQEETNTNLSARQIILWYFELEIDRFQELSTSSLVAGLFKKIA